MPMRVRIPDTVCSGIPQARSDLSGRHPQTAERSDRLDPALASAVPNTLRRRAAIEQPGLTLFAIALGPLAGGALAHLGGRGRRAERPTLLDNPPRQSPARIQTESGVSVDLHPVTSLGLSRLEHLSASKE